MTEGMQQYFEGLIPRPVYGPLTKTWTTSVATIGTTVPNTLKDPKSTAYPTQSMTTSMTTDHESQKPNDNDGHGQKSKRQNYSQMKSGGG